MPRGEDRFRDCGVLAETLSRLIDGSMVAAHGTRKTGLARSARAKAAVWLKLAAAGECAKKLPDWSRAGLPSRKRPASSD